MIQRKPGAPGLSAADSLSRLPTVTVTDTTENAMPSEAQKLSVTKLARMRNQSVVEVQQQLIERGYMEVKSGLHFFTDSGREVGGEIRKNHPNASEGHMVWPATILL